MDVLLKEGFVLKKKRKKGQGFAKRYLTLTAAGQLSYATAPKSAPRESGIISSATIGLQAQSREMTLDFGTDVWLLRFLSGSDYEQWLANFRSCRATFNEMRRTSMQASLRTSIGSKSPRLDNLGMAEDGSLDQQAVLKAVNDLAPPIQELEQIYASLKVEQEQSPSTLAPQAHSKIKNLFGNRRPSSARPENAPNPTSIPPSPSGSSLSAHSATTMVNFPSDSGSSVSPTSTSINQNMVQKFGSSLQAIQAQQKLLLDLLTQATAANSRTASSLDLHSKLSHLARSNSIDSQHSFGGDTIFVDAPDEYFIDGDDYPEENTLDDVTEVDDFQSVLGSPTSPPESPVAARTQTKTDAVERRTRLPAGVSGDQVSLFSILKKAVGKDLSRISMPIAFNEPLSALQRLAEEMECTQLLRSAADSNDPIERISLVAAFIISGYASARYRTSRKPFNPLMGETYECLRPDKRLNFYAEKVCHRPVVLASYAEDPDQIWTYEASSSMQEKFYGRSLEFTPTGQNKLVFPAIDETYSWKLPNTYLRNIMGGEKYVEHVGELNIVCSNGFKADIEFHGSSMWSSSGRNKLSGTISDDSGESLCTLAGRWDESLGRSEDMHSKTWREIWRHPIPEVDPSSQYGFGPFAIELNELTPDIAKILPPTDSRFRPDQRAFEEGRVDEAEQLKAALEDRQRQRRQTIEEENLAPRWFHADSEGKYTFDQQSYLEHRSNGNWEDKLAIFEVDQ